MKFLKLKKINPIVIIIVAVFLFDFITKYFLVFNIQGFKRYSALPKIFIEIGAIVYILKNGIKDKRIVTYVFILILISISSTIISLSELTANNLLDKLYNLNKYLFLFLFATAFLTFKRDNRIKYLTQIRDTVLVIGVINGLFMIFGFLFDYEILKAYAYSQRFGYNGFLLKTSEASYLYILLIITTYYDYLYNKTKGILCLYFILISFLIGTKAVWLFVVLLILLHFFNHKNKLIKQVFGASLIVGSIMLYIFKEYIIKIVVNLFSFGPEIYNEHGFITLLTSTRDLLFFNTLSHLKEHGTFVIYLFGGVNLKDFGVEFELVDLFLFFGVIGLLTYVLIVKKLFFDAKSTKRKTLLFLALMCISFFAGNFFMSIICSIFAFVIFKHMDYLNKELV